MAALSSATVSSPPNWERRVTVRELCMRGVS
jgi:hypothetical protein